MKDLVYSLLAVLYPHGLFQKFAYFLNVILSYKIASKLESCGNGTRFSKVEFSTGLSKICVGSNTVFLPHLFLTAWGNGNKKICIGDNCSIGAYCHISAFNHISIGNNVLIGKWVTIVDNNHGFTDYATLLLPPLKRSIVSKGPIVIGDNVWIGDKVTILSGVTIGNNSVIAANTVVTKDVPAFSIVVGNPAKIVKMVNAGNKP